MYIYYQKYEFNDHLLTIHRYQRCNLIRVFAQKILNNSFVNIVSGFNYAHDKTKKFFMIVPFKSRCQQSRPDNLADATIL